MQHFGSAVPNAARFHEYKGGVIIPAQLTGAGDLRSRDGKARVPTGAGSGVDLDPGWLAKGKQVSMDRRKG